MAENNEFGPYAEIVNTRYGKMIVNKFDTGQVPWLRQHGSAVDAGEIEFLQDTLHRHPAQSKVFFDIGACFGTYSLALAPFLGPHGQIIAFEPQPPNYYMFCGSVALNGLENVYPYLAALSDRNGVVELPRVDYCAPLNFGGLEFGKAGQVETLAQAPQRGGEITHLITAYALDTLSIPPPTLMKIDAEGMEMQILEGAKRVIQQHKPLIYIEYQKSPKAELFARLTDFGYAVHERFLNFYCEPV